MFSFLVTAFFLLIKTAGIFTMVLSEITKSNIGSLATVVVILFMARLMPIPATWRALSQIWNFFPINMLKLDAGFTDMRLVSFFGLKLTSWQSAPFLYVLLAALLVFAGKRVYCSYQVQGR